VLSEATQYEAEFVRTGGQHDLEVQAVTLLFEGRAAAGFVERSARANTFHLAIPGIGSPLTLRAVVRRGGGTDSRGEVVVRKSAA